jgi:hypothetical protein
MVEMVVSRVAGIGTVLGSLAGWLPHGQRREEVLFGLYLREELGLGLDLGLGCGQSSTAGLLGGPDGPVGVEASGQILGGDFVDDELVLRTYLLGSFSLRGAVLGNKGSAGLMMGLPMGDVL